MSEIDCKCWRHQKNTSDYDAVEYAEKKARIKLLWRLYWANFGTRLLARVLGL